MAAETRSEAPVVVEALRKNPAAFDFFQAVRAIESRRPATGRVGRALRPGDEAVRFGQEPALRFAPSTIHGVEQRSGARAPRVLVNFFGLLGPNGPLPLHLTEYVAERMYHHNDRATARFFDVFNHRLISLFYRGWADNNQTVSHEMADRDRFAVYIASLFGMGMPSFRDRDEVPYLAKLHYAGPLVCQTRHAAGLCALLQDYFGLRAEIEQFVGRWMGLPEDCRCRLGADPGTGRLGASAVVGSRVWDCQQTFRIRLGPMDLCSYERMLPGGASFKRLRDWVRNYAGDVLRWELQLVLAASEVPVVQLGGAGRLGWSTWLKSRAFDEDADQLVLRG
ncbi:MAG: type VI secretion system baseplate subunit TssG [Kiritimatiellae bacterium]|nr:type VI secretion system baseplate subunit TssG [Kiritimatiellia bacterium]